MNISVSQNIRMSFDAVWVHRFRSLLTILGIVIGITTVVTVASLLTGLRQGVVDFFQEMGPDNIFLFKSSGDPSQDARNAKERQRRPLKPEFADYSEALVFFGAGSRFGTRNARGGGWQSADGARSRL